MDRRVIGPAIIDGFPDVATDENGVVTEMAFHLRRHVIRTTQGEEMDNLHVTHEGRPLQQRLYKGLRLGTAWLDVNAHAGLDRLQSLFCCLYLLCVIAMPGHN